MLSRSKSELRWKAESQLLAPAVEPARPGCFCFSDVRCQMCEKCQKN